MQVTAIVACIFRNGGFTTLLGFKKYFKTMRKECRKKYEKIEKTYRKKV